MTPAKILKFGGWNENEILSDKLCIVCQTKFHPRSGAHKFCSPQCKGRWPYITGAGSTENQYKKISGNWDRYISRLICKQDRKHLSRNDLLQLLEAQNYRCALSGVPLTCTLVKGLIAPTNASLDQIIPSAGYTLDNIQFVCRALNSWRSDTPLPEFIDWCRKVAEFNKKEEE